MVEKTQHSAFWPSFYEPFRHLGTRLSEWLAPASEASSNDKAYRIAVELPGVEEKDIEVSVDDGVVTVKGEKRESREEKGETWYPPARRLRSRQHRRRSEGWGANIDGGPCGAGGGEDAQDSDRAQVTD